MRYSKKGQLGEQTSYVLLLFLLVVVGGGIAIGWAMVFGGGYDFRAVDANLLNYRITECMSQNVINDSFFAKFYEICGINRAVIENNYGIRICAGVGIEECRTAVSSAIKISAGRADFILCATEAAKRSRDIGLCGTSEIVYENQKYSILTMSSVRARATAGAAQ